MRETILCIIICVAFWWVTHPIIDGIGSFFKVIGEIIVERWRIRKKFLRFKVKTFPDIKPEPQGPYR